jgi:predicted transcriptional regulator
MKTAVSIPDSLFARADALAERLGKSRSEIYREALAEYVARRDPQAVTTALDEVVGELGGEIDPFVAEAGHRTLETTEW